MRLALLALFTAAALPAQNPDWTAPFPPHTIAGNLHYIGTKDLACYLITTPKGHILINTGLGDSTPLLQASARKLGFDLKDTKILLTMQAHYDHTAALAEIQKLSGAKVYATVGDAAYLEDGGKSDPLVLAFADQDFRFPPVKVDRRLKDGDTVALGGTEVKVISLPGHTRGAAGYSVNGVLLVNVPSVVVPLIGNKAYPNIVEDYEATFVKLKQLRPTIWVAGHGSQYNLSAKHAKGSFADPEGYATAIANAEKTYREKLAREKAAKGQR
jgi:metallo-beta-lactamase class B